MLLLCTLNYFVTLVQHSVPNIPYLIVSIKLAMSIMPRLSGATLALLFASFSGGADAAALAETGCQYYHAIMNITCFTLMYAKKLNITASSASFTSSISLYTAVILAKPSARTRRAVDSQPDC